jgi:hypothetical protein
MQVQLSRGVSSDHPIVKNATRSIRVMDLHKYTQLRLSTGKKPSGTLFDVEAVPRVFLSQFTPTAWKRVKRLTRLAALWNISTPFEALGLQPVGRSAFRFDNGKHHAM